MTKSKSKWFSFLRPGKNEAIDHIIRRRTITSFLYFSIAIVIGLYGWKWLNDQPKTKGALHPLRETMKFNEKIFGSFIYSNQNVAPVYSIKDAEKKVRVNGDAGMSDDFEPEDWVLAVVKSAGDTLYLNIEDIKKLPKTEFVFDFKCVEGWNQITHWGGTKFSDFMLKYNLGSKDGKQPDVNNFTNLYRYVGLITPDEEYYVGMDMPSMLHPQSILCYEMNGRELPFDQGAPLRLITPVKYGVKSIKRIGTIFFSDNPPADYWGERGYDYYLGL
jgi:DMSO/TMAO reductase YedYZ molybdopterin-dependent catalytic subunit